MRRVLATLGRKSQKSLIASPSGSSRTTKALSRSPKIPQHRTSPSESWDFPRAESTVLELAHVYCTSHQSNFFAAAWYRAPCSAKQNLNFGSRLTPGPPTAPRSAAPLKRLLAFRLSLITCVTKCSFWTSTPLAQTVSLPFLPASSPYSQAPKPNRKSGIRIPRKPHKNHQTTIF